MNKCYGVLSRSCCFAVYALLGISLIPAAAGSTYTTTQISVAAGLDQVRGGIFDGREYLTLHIDGRAVGPESCRGTVLTMNAGGLVKPDRYAEIGALALSALLRSDTVLIIVPMNDDDCVDGRPTFTDLYLLPSSL